MSSARDTYPDLLRYGSNPEFNPPYQITVGSVTSGYISPSLYFGRPEVDQDVFAVHLEPGFYSMAVETPISDPSTMLHFHVNVHMFEHRPGAIGGTGGKLWFTHGPSFSNVPGSNGEPRPVASSGLNITREATYYISIEGSGRSNPSYENHSFGQYNLKLWERGQPEPASIMPPIVAPASSSQWNDGPHMSVAALKSGLGYRDELGPDDTRDIFSFRLVEGVDMPEGMQLKITWQTTVAGSKAVHQFTDVYSGSDPLLGPGVNHKITIAGNYANYREYTLRAVEIVPYDPSENVDVQQIINDLQGWMTGAYSLAEMIGKVHQLHTRAGRVGVEAVEKSLKHFGALGHVLDIGARLDDIYLSDNPMRELLAEVADIIVGLAFSKSAGIVSGGLASLFSGPVAAAITSRIGDAVGSVAGAYLYNRWFSETVKDEVRKYYDSVTANPGPVAMAAFFLDMADTLQSDEDGEADGPVAFDAGFYLESHPEAAGLIATGEFANAYQHFMAVGLDLGHAPNPESGPVDPASVPRDLALGHGQVDVTVQAGALGAFPGDAVSRPEQALAELLAAEMASGDVALSAELSAIANRAAWDIASNGIGMERPVGVEFDILRGSDLPLLSDGSGKLLAERFGSQFEKGLNWGLIALVVRELDGDPEAAAALLLDSFAGQKLVAPTNLAALGVAEFGGYWVVLATPEKVEEEPPEIVDRHERRSVGGPGADYRAMGSWTGSFDGGPRDDVLIGGPGDDELFGGDGDDWLDGGAGNDRIDGGKGTDTYVARGPWAAFTVTRNGAIYTLFDGTFTDTVENVEIIQFADGEIDLRDDPDAIFTAPPAPPPDDEDEDGDTPLPPGGSDEEDQTPPPPPPGAESHDLGTGAFLLEGSAADLAGDTIFNFGPDDTIRIRGGGVTGLSDLVITGNEVRLAAAGPASAPITFDGDFSDGRFFLVTTPDGAGTDLFFAPFLADAALVEAEAVPEAAVNGAPHPAALTGDGQRSFRVTLSDKATADDVNALGVYEIDAAGDIVDARILFSDVKADPTASAAFGDVEAGHRLGFFIVHGGAGSGAVAFTGAGGGAANVADGAGFSLRIGGRAVEANVFHAFSAALNADGLTHARSGADPSGTGVRVAFEDLLGGGDRDFQDVVFRVDVLDAAGDFLL